MDSARSSTHTLRRRSVAVAAALALGVSTALVATVPASAAATAKPKITSQPVAKSVVSGSTASFSVKATGGSLKYQWASKKPGSTKWVNLTTSTAKKSTLKVKTKASLHGTQYRVVVTNKLGKKTSSAAKLTVQTTPKITTQPASGYSETGKTKTLSVKASGNSLKYQWYTKTTSGGSWTKVAGATSSSYKFTTKSGTRYYLVKARNSAGSKNSVSTKIVGMAAPKVTKQPETTTAEIGANVTLAVTASGSGLKYQWQHYDNDAEKWSNISGATTESLDVVPRDDKQLTSYRVRIENQIKRIYSDEAAIFALSSDDKPFQPETVIVTGDYGFLITQTYTADLSDGQTTDVWATVAVCSFAEDPFGTDPYWDVFIDYIGTDGNAYGNEDFVSSGLHDVGVLYSGDCSAFLANAYVPTKVTYGGNWYLEDNSGVFPIHQFYVQGAR